MIKYVCDKCGCEVPPADLWLVSVTAGEDNVATYIGKLFSNKEYVMCGQCQETLMKKEDEPTQ